MNRRRFINQLLTVSAGTMAVAYDNPFRARFRVARAAGEKSLIVIFQRGGCDGLNTVIPFGDSNYFGLRPTIGVPAPNPLNPNAAINLNGFFGLHPQLAPLKAVYDAGDLAVMPAVHYPNGSQSHFDGQQFIESGAPDPSLDGWLNRHLVAFPRTLPLRAAGFGSELPHALRGSQVVSTFNNVTNFNTGLGDAAEQALIADLTRVYNQGSSNPDKAYRELVQESGRVMVNDLDVLSAVDTSTYVPANGAVYPSTGLGNQLKQVAQLIKQDLGLECACLGIGGWDTHDNQGGPESTGQQARRHADFAGSIAALWRDLGTRMADVIVLSMTEFGRTSRENAGQGTDHGHAAAWFAVGGPVTSGIYGAWPGLATAQLLQGRYLNHSLDYRNVMAEILVRHLGDTTLGTVLPGWTYSPIGFLPA